jgi:23S rRNA pseudouridine2605 synthase
MDNKKKKTGERIAKYMSRAGICSRREAERRITDGRVTVNGKTLDTPAFLVTDQDTVIVDGKPVGAKENTRLFLYHKPAGLVTSHNDEKGRDTVFDKLPADLPRVISVGRLDMNTEGLLLLTNDGELSRYLEHPDTGWSRKYRVRVHGKINERRLHSLKKGITIEGIRYKSIDVTVDSVQGTNTWLTIILREGKNREIRRVMEHLGLHVTRLIRISYGPFNLDKLPKSSVKEVTEKTLKAQLAKFFKQTGYMTLSSSEHVGE